MVKSSIGFGIVACALATSSLPAQTPRAPDDATAAAKAFGARPYIRQISLSPDGKKVAMVTSDGARGTQVLVADPFAGGDPVSVARTDGVPQNIGSCGWVTDTRLTCTVFFVSHVSGEGQIASKLGVSRRIAVNSDGSNMKVLSADTRSRSVGFTQYGGEVIDWNGDAKGAVLMTRAFIPEVTVGTRLASSAEGLGVERVDTLSLRRTPVEPARIGAAEYLTDGHGTVRMMGVMAPGAGGQMSNRITYSYRRPESRNWEILSDYVYDGGGQMVSGFNPYAVDYTSNAAYGVTQLDGRLALYKVALDGTKARELLLSRPDVDIDGLIRIGRQHRVVGASYATETRLADYFDPDLKQLRQSLGKALPGHPLIDIVDASADEATLLIYAGSDTDPGRYYLYSKTTRQLTEVLPARPQLAAWKLGTMKPITYTAADGTRIPAYLTLPAGSEGRGLPAIVMPHGGPGARDEWGFDWLAQFFAARGYAVIQPNFRGSAGYGSSWFQKNGFQSWKTAIGDVNDAGRWLVAQGVADPKKLAIVGWSYGGYAALQSSALDPNLFKAVAAVAPVTDLNLLVQDALGYTSHALVARFVGSGPHVTEGSPARNAAAIKAPVLLFHGDDDLNVDVGQSRLMASKLRAAGGKVEYVEYKGLEHQLDDSMVRADLLFKTDAFLRGAMGM